MPIRTMRPRMGLVAATVAVLCLPAIGQDVDFKKLQTLPAFVKAAKLKELPEQTEFETAETYVRKILASGKDAQLVVDLETSQPGPPDPTGFWYDPTKEAFILREYSIRPVANGPSQSKKRVGGNSFGAVGAYTSTSSVYYAVDPAFWIKAGTGSVNRTAPGMVAASGLARLVEARGPHGKTTVLEAVIPTPLADAPRKTQSFAVVYVGRVFGLHTRHKTTSATFSSPQETQEAWSDLVMDARSMKVFIVDKALKTVLARVEFATKPSPSYELVLP